MIDAHISRKILKDLRAGKIEFIVLNIELLFVPNDAFWTHTRYLLASDWFINLWIEWCLGVGKYKRNTPEK